MLNNFWLERYYGLSFSISTSFFRFVGGLMHLPTPHTSDGMMTVFAIQMLILLFIIYTILYFFIRVKKINKEIEGL